LSVTLDPRLEKLSRIEQAADELIKSAEQIKMDVGEIRREIAPKPAPAASGTGGLERALAGLKWTEYPSNNGAWAFYLEKGSERTVKSLVPYPDFITDMKSKV
jgi:hypothetical protein